MKKTLLFSTALLGTIVLSTVANAADQDKATSIGTITMAISKKTGLPTDPKVPVDPTDPTGQTPKPLPPGVIITPTPGTVTPGTPLVPGTQVDPEYPNVVIPFEEGDLKFGLIPKNFNFGEREISSTDKVKSGKFTYKQVPDKAAVTKGYGQALQVHDGRPDVKGYKVYAKLEGFAKLKGVDISFTKVTPTAFKGLPKATPFTISADNGTSAGTVMAMSSTNIAGGANTVIGDGNINWDYEDVTFSANYSSVTAEKHEGTISWTLSDEPGA